VALIDSRRPSPPSTRSAAAALAIACTLSAAPACGPAVRHPAITAGVVAGAMGFATCKLASDNYAACGVVGGGAGAFLGLVTAVALWLGGDGNSTGLDDPPQPLPEDDAPPLKLDPLPAGAPPLRVPPATTPPPSTPPPSTPPP
jgi:hypothetical protein